MTRSLIVGAGSIGQRHAAVLAELGHQIAFMTARGDLEAVVFRSIAAAIEVFSPDYVIIASATADHAEAVRELAATGYGGILLVEKPVAVAAVDLASFERVGVGYNLRFHPVISRMRQLLSSTKVFTVEAYVGQHLSLWRPGRATTDQYSSFSAAGGGALRDLSHEFDYLGWFLGGIRGLFALGGRVAEVTVDSDDAWAIVAEYEAAALVSVQLNYLDSAGRRHIRANTEAGSYCADVIAGTVETPQGIERFDLQHNESYRDLHVAMLAGDDTVCTASEALAVETIIAMAERSAEGRVWVNA